MTNAWSKLIVNTLCISTLVAGLLWGWGTLKKPETFPIQSIRIEGEFRHLSRHTLEQMILPYVMSHGFFAIDVKALKDQLLTLAWIDTVSISRWWPDILIVRIAEQKAVARWGDFQLINQQGGLFSPPKETIPQALPLLRGPEGQQQWVLIQYVKMEKLLKPIGFSIKEIDLSARHAWELHMTDGALIVLGRREPIERLTRFVKFYDKIRVNRTATLERADLRYPIGVAVRWKEAS